MDFHAFQDTFAFTKRYHRGMTPQQFYRSQIQLRAGKNDNDFACDLSAEFQWYLAGRPYYKVWPCMIEVLRAFDINNVPLSSFFNVSDPTIVILFPKGNEIAGCMCALVSANRIGCGQWIHFNNQSIKSEVIDETLGPEHVTFSATLHCHGIDLDKRTYGEVPFSSPESCDKESHVAMQRVCLAVLLMERTPDIFEPDILSKYVDSYESASETRKKEIEEKSFRRRGQRGYHIGRIMESIPHFRRPHPALYWTGRGRSVAKVVMRSGCLVNRQIVTKAPTGYMGPADESEGRPLWN
jgi:hypothetical protein